MKCKLTPWLFIIAVMVFFLIIGALLGALKGILAGQEPSMVFLLLAIAVLAWIVYDVGDRKRKTQSKSDLLPIGKVIFARYQEEFVDFYNLYLADARQFTIQYAELLKDNGTYEAHSIRSVDVFNLFATSKGLACMTDWRGEDNEGEIEGLIDALLQQECSWHHAAALRLASKGMEQHDGIYIISLFKAMDKDLQQIHHRLLFFDIGSDYVYTIISSDSYNQIAYALPHDIFGVDGLK